MDSRRLAEIKARADAATPGPWEWWTSNSWRRLSATDTRKDGDVLCPVVNPYDKHPDLSVTEPDMEFIAHARGDVPDLLAEVDGLRAAIDGLRNVTGTRRLRLKDHPWLNDLRRPGWAWELAPEDRVILVVATANDLEWTAYYQSPYVLGAATVESVKDYGTKLPEEVARELFPFVPLPWRA